MVHTLEQAQEILAGETHIALDLETGGFSPWKTQIHVITLYGAKSQTPVILHYPKGRRVTLKVLRWLEEFQDITTHNGTMFDILFLANAGMDYKKVTWYDTLIGELAVITAARRNVRVNLEASIKRRTGGKIDKNINHESWGNDFLDAEQMAYLHGDISHLWDLRKEQFSRANESPNMLRNLEFEQSLIPIVVEMELRGLPISMPKLQEFLAVQEVAAEKTKGTLEQLLDIKIIEDPKHRVKGANQLLITSPKQLKDVLQEKFGERAFPDTTAETLQNYLIFGGDIQAVCQNLLDFRHANRREKMYAPKWQQEFVVNHDGDHDTRVHGKFWQIGTETGRFSSSQPNLQQIPRDMRAVFEANPGMMVGATDYSGIEVRVAAALAEDTNMIEVFQNGEDIHTVVAAAGFSIPTTEVTKAQRQIAKAMSFTLLFGGGVETFRAYATARGSSISFEDAELAVERFFERFDGIRQMRQTAIWQAQNLRAVTILYPTGLKRVLFNDSLRGSIILNNIVQGTAAAGLKYALKECQEAGVSKYISAVVHDEIVYTAQTHEITEVRDEIEQAMIRGMDKAMQECVYVPVVVESEHGISWAGDSTTEHLRSGPSIRAGDTSSGNGIIQSREASKADAGNARV
jgi:DNA polymerase-1